MRVLYCALDQRVPGTVGGATHVRAVAEGLARLGHDVWVLTGEGSGGFPAPPAELPGRLRWQALAAPFGRPHLRLLRRGAVAALARSWQPDVVIERYHNFGGEGVLAARAIGTLAVLEINAPVIDHPGSRKALVDRLLLVQPMRRWRERLCRLADLFVTPSRRVLPPWVDSARVLEVEWGADTERFRPEATGPVPFTRRDDEVVAIFAGAFRAWHGAHHLAEAVARLEADGVHAVHAVFIGEGPELPRAKAAAARLRRATFTGALPYEAMPAALAAADVGVAPFDVPAHAPLRLEFYWSPLKIFEYMAAGKPVIAPKLPRLASLVEHGREGVLYEASDPAGLAHALRLTLDPGLRRALGQAARARVERDFSWRAHCQHLDAALTALLARRGRR